MSVLKETILTPLRGEYDIIVAGGGISGICAAISSKRSGAKKVLLIEKSIQLGGLATSGLINCYEPLCDGNGNKIMYGLAYELMQLAISFGGDSLPNEWIDNPDKVNTENRLSTYFSHSIFALGLDQLLIGNNVEILLDSRVVKPVMTAGKCKGVIVENKSGRGFYKSKVTIDATGDLDILWRAGAPCENGKNFLTYLAYYSDMNSINNAIETNDIMKLKNWMNIGSNMWGDGHPKNMPTVSGTTAEEVTQFVLDGRSRLFEKIKKENRHSRDITVLPNMAQLRMIRRLVGEYTLTEKDEGRHFKDSIGIVGDFVNRGKIYELPYGMLYNSDYGNLLVAGRCVSSSDWAWEVTRVIPAAAATGQAAGAAAAICADRDITPGEVDIKDLQRLLTKAGVNIHI